MCCVTRKGRSVKCVGPKSLHTSRNRENPAKWQTNQNRGCGRRKWGHPTYPSIRLLAIRNPENLYLLSTIARMISNRGSGPSCRGSAIYGNSGIFFIISVVNWSFYTFYDGLIFTSHFAQSYRRAPSAVTSLFALSPPPPCHVLPSGQN